MTKSQSKVTRGRIGHMDHIEIKLKTTTGPDETKEAFFFCEYEPKVASLNLHRSS